MSTSFDNQNFKNNNKKKYKNYFRFTAIRCKRTQKKVSKYNNMVLETKKVSINKLYPPITGLNTITSIITVKTVSIWPEKEPFR